MTPTYTRKGAIKYRYYISRALVEGRPEHAGSIKRIPAAEIEATVTKSVLQSPRRFCQSRRKGLGPKPCHARRPSIRSARHRAHGHERREDKAADALATGRGALAEDISYPPTRDPLTRDPALSSCASDPIREPRNPNCVNCQSATMVERPYDPTSDHC
jgi:hypothetical protein